VYVFIIFIFLKSTLINFRTPVGLEDVSTYPKLIEYLVSEGNWTNDDIIKLIGGNIIRVLEDNEKVYEEILFSSFNL
jgi:microsomal dipeptidase-like Zn-dependent dipeptidase